MVASPAERVGALDTLANIYLAPAAAFAALKERPTSLLPVLALIVASCAVTLWYYSGVDISWLLERSLDPAQMTPQVQKALASSATRYAAMGSSSVAAALILLVVFLVNAGYLSFVSLLTNDGMRFRQWFSLVAWSSLPGLLSQLAALVNLAVSDISHLPQERLNPLSFASLLDLDLAGAGRGTMILASMDPLALWTLALMTVGYRLWTGKGFAASALIVAAPLLVVVALVAAL
ncbi:MAG TPA: YIP1 family protein [Gammaproteobacteria bacterium]|nr:YIP1 family protein [Gammaproteobacteria bacterium]